MKESRKEKSNEIANTNTTPITVDRLQISRTISVCRRRPAAKTTGTESESAKKTKKYQKKLRDRNAPKKPLTPYLIFMTEQKRLVAQTKECLTQSQQMTVIGHRWSALSDEERRPYLEKAKVSRAEYEKRLEEYRKTDNYQRFIEEKAAAAKERRRKSKAIEAVDENEPNQCNQQPPEKVEQNNDIAVFSNQFLEYNKAQETELRKLRQKSSALEEENRLISENISRLKAAIAARKRENQLESLRSQEVLKIKEKWSNIIKSALSGVVISGAPPVTKNIDAYMERLHYLVMHDPQHPAVIEARMALSNANFL